MSQRGKFRFTISFEKLIGDKHPRLWTVEDAYFFLLLSSPCLSMYDKVAKTTNNRVSKMENKKADKIDFLKQGKRGSNPR